MIAGRDVVMPPEPRAGIPPEPIEHLVGREGDLLELRERIFSSRRVMVSGLGRVGKT